MWWSVSGEMGCGVCFRVADRVKANGAVGQPAAGYENPMTVNSIHLKWTP